MSWPPNEPTSVCQSGIRNSAFGSSCQAALPFCLISHAFPSHEALAHPATELRHPTVRCVDHRFYSVFLLARGRVFPMSDNSESLSGAMTTSNSMPKMSPSKEALHFTGSKMFQGWLPRGLPTHCRNLGQLGSARVRAKLVTCFTHLRPS